MAAVVRRRIEMAGDGYPPLYPAVTLAGSAGLTIGAVVQRLPLEPPWWALLGAALASLSLVVDLWIPSKVACGVLAAGAVALMLMDPVPVDVAPLLLALTTAIAAAMESLRRGLAVAALSVAVVLTGSQSGHLQSPVVYVLAILCGWLVGYMILYQKLLSQNELRDQQARSERAASEERRRIAREVHDVIAHSLSITMLNVTGARRALQEGAHDEALEALEDAERLGRQAMTEIRYIVKVLGSSDDSAAPTPGARDIDRLVDDYRKAGVAVSFDVDVDLETIPAPLGAALYRITQESLTNVVKHSRNPTATVTLTADSDLVLCVRNPCPPVTGRPSTDGSGIDGMKQRAQLLGGFVEAGGQQSSWVVRAAFPGNADAVRRAG
ncbi:sensor histidine kinase [Streptomyces sp. SID6673]|nr:sensor histidine kinase [Streptomyces sp. SID11726]NEB26074.1 sensor histidine kinase [Streptomyces sp. SID6673]